MEIHAYDEDYIISAQRILGDMLDFAVNSCELDADNFFKMFLASGAAEQFANGNPTYVAGMTGCELVRKVFIQSGLSEPSVPDEMYLDKSPEYWAGWALAYYQWYTAKTFFKIYHAVSIQEILSLYPVYHEMDISKFIEVMNQKLQQFYVDTNLKRIRQFAGLSQSDLAKKSGISLNQIQLFEQRQQDINRTQAINLFKISKALGCRCEDLLEI